MRVAVVGAGVSGLANAFELKALGHEVAVYESSGRAGGNIRTEEEDGYTVEWGPNGFLDNVPQTFALLDRLSMREEIQVSSELARTRFLFRRGELLELPERPPAFLRSPLLSPLGRARVLLEPLARGRPRHDETVHAFAARRIGREAADVLVQAMVSGVFAGDARRLSLRSTFPKMHAMEAEHGSLFRALMARRKAGPSAGGPAGPGGTLTSFRGGMESLVSALVASLGERLRLSCPVGGILPTGDGYLLEGPGEKADAVVLACPAGRAAEVLASLSPIAARLLSEIAAAPLVVVATAYEESELGGPPPGFGFLVPRGEGIRLLGCLWTSSIYPGTRAPTGKVLLRSMVGGALDPEAVDLEDEALLDLVARELEKTMGLRAAPVRHWVFRHRSGIPQYPPGHGTRLAGVARDLAAHPRILLAGSSYRGVSVNSVIQEASAVSLSPAASRPGSGPPSACCTSPERG